MSLEPGIYPAKVNNIDEIDGQFGLQWRFEFAIDNSEERPWAWATAKIGTKTKLYKWATALLGRQLAIGERLVRAELIGKPCNVIIKEKPDMEADGGMRRYVDDIIKAKGAGKSEPTPPLAAKCAVCKGPVFKYTDDGVALCEKHAAEAE